MCRYSEEQVGFVDGGGGLGQLTGPIATAEECKTRCSQNVLCNSYNYFGKKQECMLRSTGAPENFATTRQPWHKKLVYATKVAGSCATATATTAAATAAATAVATTAVSAPQQPATCEDLMQFTVGRTGYHGGVSLNVDAAASVTDVAGCATVCVAFPKCVAFNYFDNQKTCLLKVTVASTLKLATDEGGLPWHSKYVYHTRIMSGCRVTGTVNVVTQSTVATNANIKSKFKEVGRGSVIKLLDPLLTDTTVEKCTSACGNIAECLSFSYFPFSQVCRMSSQKISGDDAANLKNTKGYHNKMLAFEKLPATFASTTQAPSSTTQARVTAPSLTCDPWRSGFQAGVPGFQAQDEVIAEGDNTDKSVAGCAIACLSSAKCTRPCADLMLTLSLCRP